MSMALNTPDSTSASRQVLIMPAGTPYFNRVTGNQPRDLADAYTWGYFVYPRAAQSQAEIDNSPGGSSAIRDLTFTNRPWHDSASTLNYVQAFSGADLRVTLTGSNSCFIDQTTGIRGNGGQNVSNTTNLLGFGDSGGGGENINNRWLFIANTFDIVTGESVIYIYDPSNGALLDSVTGTNAPDTASTPYNVVSSGPASNAFLRFEYQIDQAITPLNLKSERHTDWDVMLAEYSLWERKLTPAELSAYSQVGFAEVNAATGLVLDFNFMRDWRPTSTTQVQSTVNPLDIMTFNSEHNVTYRTDAPVPVYLLSEGTTKEFDNFSFDLFSASSGTAKIGAWPSGTSQPSDADIFNGVGAVEIITVQPDGINELTASLTTLTTGTSYEIFSIQDEGDLGSYGAVASLTITTPFKFSELILDREGNAWESRTDVKWSWFDSTDTASLGSPSAEGSLETTAAGTGLCEATLPTSISTAKGAEGTLLISFTEDTGEGPVVRTGYKIATVK